MKIVKPSFTFETPIDGNSILRHIEKAGRTAYKSEEKTSNISAEKFVKNILRMGHESVIEHFVITARVVCDRGVSHEIVRHRLASYTQESTRYCNYSKGKFGKQITVIEPCFWDKNIPNDNEKFQTWKKAMLASEESYLKLIESGSTPQEARSVLPNSLKTEIVMTMNLREWRHFFKLRTSTSAHPQMREIAKLMLSEFKQKVPVIFDEI